MKDPLLPTTTTTPATHPPTVDSRGPELDLMNDYCVLLLFLASSQSAGRWINALSPHLPPPPRAPGSLETADNGG